MSILQKDEYFSCVSDGTTGGDFYTTELKHYPDGDYSLRQAAHASSQLTDRVYLNRKQAINYAKAILRNEGIHAID